MKKLFNLQHGILGFLNTGLLTFIININFGIFSDSLIAALIQGFITFFIVGLNTAFFEYLYFKFRYKIIAILLPTFSTAILSYIVHTLNSSPSPIGTAIGVFVFALINFCGLTILLTKTSTIKPTKLIKIFFRRILSVKKISLKRKTIIFK